MTDRAVVRSRHGLLEIAAGGALAHARGGGRRGGRWGRDAGRGGSAGAATPASGSARTSAGSGAPECAATAGPPQSTVPAPGDPCWVDVYPYPFGTDGNPVDAAACSVQGGGQTSCLKVSSFAFRAWN